MELENIPEPIRYKLSMKYSLIIVFFLFFFQSYSQEKDLNYFLGKAQKNSPLVMDWNNQLRSNTLDSLLIRAGSKPQVSGNLSATYAPTINGVGYDETITNGQVVSGLINVNKKIIGKGVLAYQTNTYEFIQQALLLKKKIAVKDLNKAITLQYITASGTLEQIVFNQKTQDLLQQETAILKKLTQNSVYKQTDYLVFSATVQQQQLTVLQFKQKYRNDLALLNYLCGETDTTSVILKSPDVSLKTLQEKEPFLFLRQFEVDSLKFVNQNKIIDSAYKPQLTLLGDAGYLSSFAVSPYKNFGVSVGLGLSIPIYDGNQRQLAHQKNDISLATNEAYKTFYQKQRQQQLLQLYLQLQQSSEIEKQLKSQLTTSLTLIEAYKKLLVSGDVAITDYAIAIGNLITVNNAITQNKINTLQTISEINYWSKNE